MSSDRVLSVEQFKLACISDDVLTDEQVEVLMRNVVLASEEDVREFVAILHKYRPNLEKRFFNRLTVDQGRVYEEVLPGVHMHRRDLEDADDINI